MSIGPPSLLVSFNLSVPVALVDAGKPDVLLFPTNGLPCVSALALVIVIALPLASVSLNKFDPVNCAVRFAILESFISFAISSAIPTAMPYAD